MVCRCPIWRDPGSTHESSSAANKSFRGSRGPEAGVRGIPSPFINLDERGRDTPHPSLLPLVLMRKDFLDEILVSCPINSQHIFCMLLRYLSERRCCNGDGSTEEGTYFERS